MRFHHYIRAILAEGPVGVEGSLRSGDEILEVNDCELVSLNHQNVVTLLKELPKTVRMVCGRTSDVTPKLCANNNVINNNNVSTQNRNNVSCSDLLWDQGKNKTSPAQKGREGIHSVSDRLVKAKSDGSLAVGINSGSSGPVLTLTDDASRIRSRSLEPLTGLAMWSADPLLIELPKGERGLGFSILDYQVRNSWLAFFFFFPFSFFNLSSTQTADILFDAGPSQSERNSDSGSQSRSGWSGSIGRTTYSWRSSHISQWDQLGKCESGSCGSGFERSCTRSR